MVVTGRRRCTHPEPRRAEALDGAGGAEILHVDGDRQGQTAVELPAPTHLQASAPAAGPGPQLHVAASRTAAGALARAALSDFPDPNYVQGSKRGCTGLYEGRRPGVEGPDGWSLGVAKATLASGRAAQVMAAAQGLSPPSAPMDYSTPRPRSPRRRRRGPGQVRASAPRWRRGPASSPAWDRQGLEAATAAVDGDRQGRQGGSS